MVTRESTFQRTHRRTRPLPWPRTATATATATEKQDRDPRGWVHQLRTLPPEALAIIEMLSVLNVRIPLAQLGQAAEAASPSSAIEPAVTSGFVDWWPQEPACPVEIRHQHVREAIYAGISPVRRRLLHARAVSLVSESMSWIHRVAALDRPDEGLAATLDRLAARDAADGRPSAAATHLRWASDISPAQADRERRLLTAAQHLTRAGAAHGPDLRQAVEAAAGSALRSYVLGTMAYSAGQLAEAERRLSQALAQARIESGSRPLAALIASGLAGAYSLLGEGKKAAAFGRLALGTGGLDATAASQTRTLVATGTAQAAGPRAALATMAELGLLEASPGRLSRANADGLSFRGMFRLLAGDLNGAVSDLSASVGLARREAGFRPGLSVHCYLALAQYQAGAWDDALITAERGLAAAPGHARRYELPLLHLVAACVPAGRGLTQEAERQARLAADAAAALDYGQERIWAAMARALACQAAGDYPGMARALGPWQDDAALDDRSRIHALLWRPLLAEGLIGSGQTGPAAVVLGCLRRDASQASYLRPALAWLEGWLAEQDGDIERAREIYRRGERETCPRGEMAGQSSPVYAARLLLAHGRLLRRTGDRTAAAERLHRAHALFSGLGAGPGTARAAEELAGCRPDAGPAVMPALPLTALGLTSRETEVAQLVGTGLSNPEIAAELFISRKAVEFHLSNVYAKGGLRGRQQLRRLVGPGLAGPGRSWGGELGSFSRDGGPARGDS
jgi:DNA-binding CsgD family transcriptional regulator/tetratricopeptide (TPR) repeat protein